MSRASTGQVTKAYMGIRLTVQTADPNDPYYRAQDFFPLANSMGFTVGSHSSNDLILQNNVVAPKQCRIFAQGPYNYVECTGAGNGTYLNDQRLAPGSPTPLRDGNRIRVGHHVITVGIGRSAFLPSQQNLDDATYDLHSNDLGSEGANPVLEIISGPKKGIVLDVETYNDIVVGRGRDCGLVLPDTAISREHLVIKRDWSGTTLLDLGSRNGVLLNGEPVASNTEVDLKDGDQIGLGHHLILYREPLASTIPSPSSMPAAVDDDRTLPPTSLSPEMQAVAERIKQQRKAQEAARAAQKAGNAPPKKASSPPSVTVKSQTSAPEKATKTASKKQEDEEMEEPMSGFYHAPPEEMKAAMRQHAEMMKQPAASPTANEKQAPAQKTTTVAPRKKGSAQWKKRLIWVMLGLSVVILGVVLVLHFRV